jgi:diguanylate cyclase (GGDEF)-like protein
LLELLATGRRSCALAAATLLVAALAGASPGGAAPAANRKAAKEFSDTLPTLTTAREAHGLSAEAAQRAYPVHLRGVVAYFDPDSGGGKAAMFVQDTSGSVYVQPPAGEVGSLSAGALVDVEGLSSPGMFAPIVTGHEIKVMGHPGLPAQAPRVGMEQLMTGAEDGQWVEVEGTVHDVSETGHHIVLQLALPEGTISVTTVWQPDALYYSLIGAQVRVRAIASPVINGSSQMIGVRLLMPNLSAMEVVKAAPGDPFLQPAVPIDNLLRWDHIADSLGRVHLRGRVTLQWPGSLLCLRDATRGICAQTAQDALIAIGDVVDVVGFATAENGVPVLTDASFRSAHSNGYVAAQPITARQALQGKNESDLVQIDAQLIGGDLESANVTLLLTSGQAVFVAVLPMSLGGTSAARWKIGSKVRVTGICSVLMDAQKDAARNGTARAKTFRILMRSPDDVIVLMRPSWWTPAHTLVVLSLAFAVMLSILGWVAALRRRVNQQTRLLRESEERFRQMAQHDALTGLATRLVLRDRLSVALENAKRHRTGLALLMVDLDKFKQINDTFGHQAGDEVLRITAERIVRTVRKSDTVARMGGDEFLVLLPDLHDLAVAEGIAAKVVAALSVPIVLAGREVPITASAGISTASARDLDAAMLMKNADLALYSAKARGRNCFQVFSPELADAQANSQPCG